MPRHGAGSVRARRAVHCVLGRCLLSGYFNHRDPNQGTCTNACRWNYATHDADIDPTTGEAIAQKMEGDFNFEAAQQKPLPSNPFSTTGSGQRHPRRQGLPDRRSRPPGQLMPIMEDRHGTYIMNSKDLRAVERGAPHADRRGFPKDRRPHQEPVLRGPHRPGLPPRH